MKILFQGDSITDNFSDHSDPHVMGAGYPKYAAEAIASRHPATEFEFLNYGISGNQTINLVERWQKDCIDHQPDLVSILIGVNDVWHRSSDRNWLANEKFEENYRYILEEVKQKTNAKILMLEPFLLDVPDKFFFREDLDPKIDIVRKLAREYADLYIPLDGIIAAACVTDDMYKWSDDGVHPNGNLSRLIGRHYADAFDKLFCSMK